MHRHIQLHQLHHRLWAPPNISPTKGFGIGMSSASDFPFAWGYWLRVPGLLRDDDNLKVPMILQAQYIPKKTPSNKIINFKQRAATNLCDCGVSENDTVYIYIYPWNGNLKKCEMIINHWMLGSKNDHTNQRMDMFFGDLSWILWLMTSLTGIYGTYIYS